MISVSIAALEVLRAEARAAYPHECCGALLGRMPGDLAAARQVVRTVPLPNTWQGERERRYLIGSDAVLNVEREAQRGGLELIGFYHSHPDHPPEPSAFDREHAWPWYAYIILAARRDATGAVRVWRLADDRSAFVEEELMTFSVEDT